MGSALIETMERMTRSDGYHALHLCVDPENNPQALALYRRLGYECIDDHPVEDRWDFVDSDGVRHEWVERVVYMGKQLLTAS